MPKLKTHSGLKKRTKITGTGRLRRRRAFRSHLLTKKRKSRKRTYTKEFDVDKSDQRDIRPQLRS